MPFLAKRKPRLDPREESLLEELKKVAAALGFEVRQEKLLREVGYRVRSGSCRIHEANVIFLDRSLSSAQQIDVLVDELADKPLDEVYVSPDVRQLLHGQA